jgi:hypothetical protein
MPPDNTFSDDLSRAISDAAQAFMDKWLPELPRLSWTCIRNELGGFVQGFVHDDVEAVAQQWRAALSLGDPVDNKGWREYCGVYDSVPIVIWYITDRDRFENR